MTTVLGCNHGLFCGRGRTIFDFNQHACNDGIVVSTVYSRLVFSYTDIHMQKKKNPSAVALGRLGGLKGGPARMAKLSAKGRSRLARKAVLARWKKRK